MRLRCGESHDHADDHTDEEGVYPPLSKSGLLRFHYKISCASEFEVLVRWRRSGRCSREAGSAVIRRPVIKN